MAESGERAVKARGREAAAAAAAVLSRAQTDSRNTIPSLVGWVTDGSFARSKPARPKESRGRAAAKIPGSLPRVIMRNETCARERRIGRIVSE